MSRTRGHHTSSSVVQHFRREEQKLLKRGRERALADSERGPGDDHGVGMQTRGRRVDWVALADVSGSGDEEDDPKPRGSAKKAHKERQEADYSLLPASAQDAVVLATMATRLLQGMRNAIGQKIHNSLVQKATTTWVHGLRVPSSDPVWDTLLYPYLLSVDGVVEVANILRVTDPAVAAQLFGGPNCFRDFTVGVAELHVTPKYPLDLVRKHGSVELSFYRQHWPRTREGQLSHHAAIAGFHEDPADVQYARQFDHLRRVELYVAESLENPAQADAAE